MRVTLFIFLLLLSSCASSKKIAIDSKTTRSDSSAVAVADTSILNVHIKQDLNIVEKNKEVVVSRETTLDSAGNPLIILETLTLSDFERYDLSRLTESFEWLSGMTSVATSGYSYETDTLFSSVKSRDSRAVQGIEWLFILIGAIILVVLYILYRKTEFRIK